MWEQRSVSLNIGSVTSKKKRKEKGAPIGEKLPQRKSSWVEWFYMTKTASLERHQMYRDDLFLDFNCVIILAAPQRFCCIKLISLWQSRRCSTSVWATLSWRSHQGWLSLEQKNPKNKAKNIFFFHQGMINWYKWLNGKIMRWIWKEASQEKLCLFQASFNELFITGQEKLLCVLFFSSSFAK